MIVLLNTYETLNLKNVYVYGNIYSCKCMIFI